MAASPKAVSPQTPSGLSRVERPPRRALPCGPLRAVPLRPLRQRLFSNFSGKRARLASSTSERTKRGQNALDLLSVRLQPRWEDELLAERGKIFVHGEAGPVGRDLEQHA